MDFLDNLENSLKNLEQQQERDSNSAARQMEARRKASEIAPWADALKKSAYVQDLFQKAAIAGHRLRSKIYIAWLENTLRLEAKGRWCEIRPTTSGIEYEFVSPDGGTVKKSLDLASDPDLLLAEWLGEGAVTSLKSE
jgi:DNA repair exonuclease SbcCD ATPase subunit